MEQIKREKFDDSIPLSVDYHLNSLEKKKDVAKIPNVVKVGNLEVQVIENLPKNFNGENFSNVSKDLQEAMKMTYNAYLIEKKYKPEKMISEAQQDTKMMWNEYDSHHNTTQLIGRMNGEIVARFRFSDNYCPLSEHFNLNRFQTKGIVREISRCIIKPEYRKSEVFKDLVAYQIEIAKDLGRLFWTGLEDSTPIYNKLGAKTIAHYWYDDFPNHPGMATFQMWDLEEIHKKLESHQAPPLLQKISKIPKEVVLN